MNTVILTKVSDVPDIQVINAHKIAFYQNPMYSHNMPPKIAQHYKTGYKIVMPVNISMSLALSPTMAERGIVLMQNLNIVHPNTDEEITLTMMNMLGRFVNYENINPIAYAVFTEALTDKELQMEIT